MLEVQRERTLATVEGGEVTTHATIQNGRPRASLITFIRILDLDDI